MALYLTAFRRLAGSLWWAILGLVLMEAGRWSFFGVFRPQTIGAVFWAATLVACARPCISWAAPVWVPICICIWANLHAAFMLAFVLMGTLLAGRVVEVVSGQWAVGSRQSTVGSRQPCAHYQLPSAYCLLHSAYCLLRDVQTRRLALVLGLSVAAACVNPYGPRLLIEVVRFGNWPSLQQVKEWQPFVPLSTYGSCALVISIILALATLRLSPRPFRLHEVVLLLFLGISAWFSARMLPWWMSVWVFVLLPHWCAIVVELTERQGDKETGRQGEDGEWRMEDGGWRMENGRWMRRFDPPSSILYPPSSARLAVYAGGVATAVVLFLASGTGHWLLYRQPRPGEKQVTAETPVVLADKLNDWIESGHEGTAGPLRIFASPLWADYVLWKLSEPGQVYWYNHWNCYSPERMRDGFQLLQLRGPPNDWRTIVNRYRLNVLVLKWKHQPDPLARDQYESLVEHVLAQADRPDAEWKIIYLRPEGPAAGLIAVRRTGP